MADLRMVSHKGTGTDADSSAWAGHDAEEQLRPTMTQHLQTSYMGQHAIREENGER